MAYKNPEDYVAYHKAYNARRRKPVVKHARAIAIENGETHYFTGKPCIHGHVAKRLVTTRICIVCDRLKKQKLRKEKPEFVSANKKKDYEKNKVKHLAQKKVYRQSNKGKINALVAKRKKHVKQRTPQWADFEKIKAYYEVCSFFNEVNGYVKYHVDHVIPLQGELVSGLHVHNNLQVLLGLDNIKKKNKFEINHA